MRKIITFTFCLVLAANSFSQIKWTNVDSLFQTLPSSVHIYFTYQSIDTAAFRAYYVIADLKDKQLEFTADTTLNRRLTPFKFYERNGKPLVVVNCTFFSFETNRNLNLVIKNGKMVGYNIHTIAGRGKDTFTYKHPLRSAIGISKRRKADIAWVYSDSTDKFPVAYEQNPILLKDSLQKISFYPHLIHGPVLLNQYLLKRQEGIIKKWKMETAVGGGPALLQNGEIRITNGEEMMFTGKAINDKHPRTAMGYTKDGKLIILAIQGRSESGGGASLPQEAQILKDLGCVEALNLDGGGSSCMLVNGKETIKPSDKEGQRPVPAVFIIKSHH